MTQEEKQLLLQDLCGRLPYGVKVFYEYVDSLNKKTYGYSLTLNTWCIDEMKAEKAVVKPYLRPMSSMTKEEEYQYHQYKNIDYLEIFNQEHSKIIKTTALMFSNAIKWLNANHFDYNGLIPMGLAIAVTEENNSYE